MSQTGMQFGIFGMALVRAADAMLRSLGGSEIRLLLPLFQIGADPGAQLGLTDPGSKRSTSPRLWCATSLPTAPDRAGGWNSCYPPQR